jgi:hypothetical protein
MPILDHFSPPLSIERVWNSFHHAWAATIARRLNRRFLPDGCFTAPNVQFGPRVTIDVGTFEGSVPDKDGCGCTLLYIRGVYVFQCRSATPPGRALSHIEDLL